MLRRKLGKVWRPDLFSSVWVIIDVESELFISQNRRRVHCVVTIHQMIAMFVVLSLFVRSNHHEATRAEISAAENSEDQNFCIAKVFSHGN